MPKFGEWDLAVDRDATAAAYASLSEGGVDRCDCAHCRNFRVARYEVLPASVLALLESLGVDFRKDAEVAQCGRRSNGRHNYSGWFHVMGSLPDDAKRLEVEFGADFVAWIAAASAPRPACFAGAQVLEIGFFCTAPWLLDELDPDLDSPGVWL